MAEANTGAADLTSYLIATWRAAAEREEPAGWAAWPDAEAAALGLALTSPFADEETQLQAVEQAARRLLERAGPERGRRQLRCLDQVLRDGGSPYGLAAIAPLFQDPPTPEPRPPSPPPVEAPSAAEPAPGATESPVPSPSGESPAVDEHAGDERRSARPSTLAGPPTRAGHGWRLVDEPPAHEPPAHEPATDEPATESEPPVDLVSEPAAEPSDTHEADQGAAARPDEGATAAPPEDLPAEPVPPPWWATPASGSAATTAQEPPEQQVADEEDEAAGPGLAAGPSTNGRLELRAAEVADRAAFESVVCSLVDEKTPFAVCFVGLDEVPGPVLGVPEEDDVPEEERAVRDALLRALAERTSGRGTAYAIGRGLVAVTLPGARLREAERLARRLPAGAIKASFSWGAAEFPDEADEVRELLRVALVRLADMRDGRSSPPLLGRLRRRSSARTSA